MCDVHGGVFVAVPSLQARGAEVLVALTPALVRALPVAMVHGDILVVALLLSGIAGCVSASATRARRARRSGPERPSSSVAYRVVKERGSCHAFAR